MKKFLLWPPLKKGFRSNGGFTLFELGITIALIGFIAGLSAYFIHNAQAGNVRREVDRLYTVMLYMQRKALLERESQRLVFDIKQSAYSANESFLLSSGVLFKVKNGLSGPPSRPTHSLKEPISWPSNTVTFFPDGTISAGAVYITDTAESCQYALTVDASEVTHIRRYRYEGKWAVIA